MALRAVPDAAVDLVVGFVHQEGKRNFEDIGDLVRLRGQLEPGTHEGDRRRDDIARPGSIRRQVAQGLYEGLIESNLFSRLPQCSSKGTRVVDLDFAARKGDLS